jgi:hypothetical protein
MPAEKLMKGSYEFNLPQQADGCFDTRIASLPRQVDSETPGKVGRWRVLGGFTV